MTLSPDSLALIVHNPPKNGWKDNDFAPYDANFKGKALSPTLGLPFPVAFFTTQIASGKEYVVGIRFSTRSKFPNVFEGTRVLLARVPGSVGSVNGIIDRNLHKSPVRLFMHSSGFWYLGLYVLVGSVGELWEFRRLSDSVQSKFPGVYDWLSLFISRSDETTDVSVGKHARTDEATDVHVEKRARTDSFDEQSIAPITLSNEVDCTPSPATRVQQLLVSWVFNDAVVGGDTIVITVAEFCRLVGSELGYATEDDGGLYLDMCACVHATLLALDAPTHVDVSVMWVQRVRTGTLLRTRMLSYTPDAGLRNTRELAGQRQLKSQIELQHNLLLLALFGPVLYETTTINYNVNGVAHSYTPDFELQGVCNMTDVADPIGGSLLVESKSEYPSREAISKCEQVKRMGRNIVILYGYVGCPVVEHQDYTNAWKHNGIRGMAFRRVGQSVEIVHDSLMFCIDDNVVSLRPLRCSCDQGPVHPRLLQLYRQIQNVQSD